jgi:hypothetical protein
MSWDRRPDSVGLVGRLACWPSIADGWPFGSSGRLVDLCGHLEASNGPSEAPNSQFRGFSLTAEHLGLPSESSRLSAQKFETRPGVFDKAAHGFEWVL